MRQTVEWPENDGSAYTRCAMGYRGTIRGGVVVLEPGAALDEGTEVEVYPVSAGLPPPQPERTTLGQRLMKFAGTARGLPPDMARHHDHYIHGTPKEAGG